MNAHNRWLLAVLGALVLAIMPAAQVHAQVQVTAADPASAPQGTVSLDVAISGNGFDSSAQVQFLVTGTTNPGGVVVKKVSVRGAKKLIATIDVADTAVVSSFDIEVTLSGGRKGKGTTLFAVQQKTNDPCVAVTDFPAFVFHTTTGGESRLYVADRTGKCARYLVSGLSSSFTRFSYPVLDDTGLRTNRGRIVWRGRDPAAPTAGTQNMFFAMDFAVTGTTVTLGAAHLVADFGNNTNTAGGTACCGIDVSTDGRDFYVPTLPVLRAQGYVHSVVRYRLPNRLEDLEAMGLPAAVTVFESTPTPTEYDGWTRDLDVNGANDLLYVGIRYGLLDGLVRVDLDPDLVDTAGNRETTVLLSSASGNSIVVGADGSNAGPGHYEQS